MKMAGTEYGAKRIKMMSNEYEHKGIAMFMKFQTDWLTLSRHQQQLAKQNNSIVYKRYCLCQKYGKHVYNILTNGGTREYDDQYVVLWDSDKNT